MLSGDFDTNSALDNDINIPNLGPTKRDEHYIADYRPGMPYSGDYGPGMPYSGDFKSKSSIEKILEVLRYLRVPLG
ncbi:proteoglycan 4-like [Plakobranchus ocellatus]|uniref:Proteoglycan 4-like n=1 Tax=Plakobranchus ocellatus TaxID=259542 RepID=A0AAV4DLN5_9GAST|nr:proteoglycan 4-like [Plakobranchus ocellatus]